MPDNGRACIVGQRLAGKVLLLLPESVFIVLQDLLNEKNM